MRARRVVELVAEDGRDHRGHAGAQRRLRGAEAAVVHHAGAAGEEPLVTRLGHEADVGGGEVRLSQADCI